jgi:arylsulfatase A-like enzyme
MEQYTSSIEDNSEHEEGFEGRKIFPYDMSVMSARKRQKPNFDILRYTPFGNTYTKDFAISTIVEEELGKDEFTDWLSVNFAATSYLGELFSSWSVEMEDMYLRLDQDIEHFLTFIDQEIGLKNVLIYVTADNAAANAPSFMLEKRMPGGYFNYNSAISLLKTYLNVIYGTGDWVSFYYAQQIFLNRELIEDSKLSISEFQDRVVRFMIQFEGVSNALSADDLIRNNYTHGTFEMMQKSYSQKRSGDILLRLNPGWVEKGIERQYASTYHYDSHVPLIWYGWKIGREEISRKLSVTDIVPTIASFLNISRPPAVQGNVIRELLD